jgi:NAD(P)-dependent dehydrogenase (short-subunit alcohol dehydrogenase family)
MSVSKRLAGKVAVISGSTSGIGRATAELFAAHGARVVVHGRRQELGQEVVAGIREGGGEAIYMPGDVTCDETPRNLVAAAVEAFGHLDILVNNAWSGPNGRLTELPLEDLDLSYRTIIRAAVIGSRCAIPEMIKEGGGVILNVSSVHGILASRSYFPYDAMKAALVNLTRQMAVDYGPQGIRVNAICPGMIVTEKGAPRLQAHPERLRLQQLIYPLGRPGTPREVAQAALFLASDEASFITGHALLVDGGLTAQLQDSVGAVVQRALLEREDPR